MAEEKIRITTSHARIVENESTYKTQRLKVDVEELQYICDRKRHLICKPYSIENLHRMANELNISRDWFHEGKDGLSHYDMPVRRIEEITRKCKVVSSGEIVRIIRKVHPRYK
jgi:hypothetical protein